MKCPACDGTMRTSCKEPCLPAPGQCAGCTASSTKVLCPVCNGTGQSRDPYLVPGQVCEVWLKWQIFRETAYFLQYNPEGVPLFVDCWPYPEEPKPTTGRWYDHYRPHGTEWDYAPDWAVCSTVDVNGEVKFWSCQHSCRIDKKRQIWWDGVDDSEDNTFFICPDKSRYENGEWMNSLRERPFWVGVKR